MVPIFSRYPSGTIVLGTKAICSRRMRRLMTFSVSYMLVNDIYFIHNYTRTLSAFPYGRTQHVRRMHSSIFNMTWIYTIRSQVQIHACDTMQTLVLTGDSI